MAAVSPAGATPLGSVTIDSTNCNSSGGCYGLDWTLSVASGTFVLGADDYAYEATLAVTDDPLVAGTPTVTISAADFKVSDAVSGAALVSFPSSSSGWSTSWNSGLNSSGCDGSGNGFVCSDTQNDPANFTASATPQTWTWYFNTTDAIFTGLDGAHIGAKMTSLSNPGQLLSASYSVPEPPSLALLLAGAAALLVYRRRRPIASRS